MIQPEAASRAFGLSIVDSADSGFVMAKATRDLVLGLTIAIFVLVKMKKALMVLALVSSIIPIIDGILVLMTAFLLWHELKKGIVRRT